MRKLAVITVLAVVLLVFLHLAYPQPGVCYGYRTGVPYPYHPIPCGVFPIGN